MTENEIHDWLRKMDKGDKEAFGVIYEQTRDQVYRTLSFLVNNRQDVHDVTSEVYMELFKSLHNYDFKQPFRSWLNGLVIRQAHNWNRRIWRKLRLFNRSKLLELEEPGQLADEQLLRNEQREAILSLVQKLPYKQREILVLRYYHDHSFEEISGLLDIPLGTVKSRHRLAIEK